MPLNFSLFDLFDYPVSGFYFFSCGHFSPSHLWVFKCLFPEYSWYVCRFECPLPRLWHTFQHLIKAIWMVFPQKAHEVLAYIFRFRLQHFFHDIIHTTYECVLSVTNHKMFVSNLVDTSFLTGPPHCIYHKSLSIFIHFSPALDADRILPLLKIFGGSCGCQCTANTWSVFKPSHLLLILYRYPCLLPMWTLVCPQIPPPLHTKSSLTNLQIVWCACYLRVFL